MIDNAAFYLTASGIFGAFVGSFLNVCIHRLPDEKASIVFPGSHCPKCHAPIQWYDNIPLLSYAILMGKCRNCKEHISFRYPFVELLTAGLFVLSMLMFVAGFKNPDLPNWLGFAAAVFVCCCLVVVTFVDFKHRIIPDEIPFAMVLAGVILNAFMPYFISDSLLTVSPWDEVNGVVSALAGALVGGLVIYIVGVLGKLVFKKEAMGFGDVKLMAGFGAFFGWKSVLIIFMIGCIAGTIVGVIALLKTKDKYIAFGPFLSLGAFLMIFFKYPIMQFILIDYPKFINKIF